VNNQLTITSTSKNVNILSIHFKNIIHAAKEKLVQFIFYYTTRRQLLQLTNDQLKDIGMTKNEAVIEANKIKLFHILKTFALNQTLNIKGN
jgi:uncharacterized protein YjiS (DUF1127 family)